MYEVNPYLIYSVDKQEKKHIVQTKKNSIIINNQALVLFLEFLERENKVNISENEIIDFFESNEKFSRKVIEFLLENEVLISKGKEELNFKKTVVYYNETKGEDLVSLLSNISESVKIIDNLEENNECLEETTMLYVFLNPFSIKELKRIVNYLERYNHLIYKVIFPYNNSIYISNYYSRKWNNPCPICFFSSLEAQLRGNLNGDINFNFQMMIDLLYRDKVDFSYDGLISNIDLIPVLNVILKEQASENVELLIDTVYKISLKNYYIDVDTAYYWEMCDCYE